MPLTHHCIHIVTGSQFAAKPRDRSCGASVISQPHIRISSSDGHPTTCTMASTSEHSYSVYLALDERSSSYRVRVTSDPSTVAGDLAMAIQDHRLIQLRLRNESFTLYKVRMRASSIRTINSFPSQYSKKVEVPPAGFFKEVKQWLHSDTPKEQMDFGFLLDEYFPNGPSHERKHVDVVIATDSCMSFLFSYHQPC